MHRKSPENLLTVLEESEEHVSAQKCAVMSTYCPVKAPSGLWEDRQRAAYSDND